MNGSAYAPLATPGQVSLVANKSLQNHYPCILCSWFLELKHPLTVHNLLQLYSFLRYWLFTYLFGLAFELVLKDLVTVLKFLDH